jgi:hypothetical protein
MVYAPRLRRSAGHPANRFAVRRRYCGSCEFRNRSQAPGGDRIKHRQTGLESPTAHEVVRRVVRGIQRTHGSAQTRKSAVSVNDLRAMLLEIRGSELKAARDRACVLLGFAAALRRSETQHLLSET